MEPSTSAPLDTPHFAGSTIDDTAGNLVCNAHDTVKTVAHNPSGRAHRHVELHPLFAEGRVSGHLMAMVLGACLPQ